MKIPSILSVALTAMIFTFGAHAATLDDAHRAFAEGKYQASTESYESVLAQDGYSAPVLFDLGNSYYRQGNFAQAILAYKRAQWLSSNDPDIAANLNMAQKQAGLTEAEPGLIEKLTGLLSASGWAWLGCGAWTLLCLSLLARTAIPRLASLFAASSFASILVLFAAVVAMVISSGELREAVVTEKNALALISPFPAAQAAFAPAAGDMVSVGKAYDDFLFVTDRAGHTGWINKAQLSPIIPARI
jgi:tetratricopeptide (TPR) repeat protein